MKTRFTYLLLAMTLLPGAAVKADAYRDATAGRNMKVSPAYFGVHLHRLLLNAREKAIPGATATRWPVVEFGSMRLWDTTTRWADVARKPGEWYFDRLDTYVATAAEKNAQVLYTLGSTPQWASARPDEKCPYGLGCSAEPVRFAHWEEYVRRVAQRYGKRISAFELWNEPYFSDLARDKGRPGFYSGSLAQMVELARIARKVIDEVSPETPLCTPGFVNGPDRLEMFLEAGGKQYVQAICYHFYAGSDEYFAQQVATVRGVMRRQGVADLPLWNTETGVDWAGHEARVGGLGALSYAEAMNRLSKLFILGAASGIERFYYFAWDSEYSGVVSITGEHLAGVPMLADLRDWLVGAVMAGCAASEGYVRCEMERDGMRFLIVWADKPGARRISIPAGYRVASIKPVGGEPVSSVPPTQRSVMTAQVGSTPLLLRLVAAGPQ